MKTKKLHQLVWDLRRDISSTWPTPITQDCLRYSFCEAAEAMDNWLRLQRPNDARNHARVVIEGDIYIELADCAMMLLSALGEVWNDSWDKWEYKRAGTLDDICRGVGWLLAMSHPSTVLWVLDLIINYDGMDLEFELVRRLDMIRRKHGG